jgi:hypothetical protein
MPDPAGALMNEFLMNLQMTCDSRNAEKALLARMGSGFRIALCVTF